MGELIYEEESKIHSPNQDSADWNRLESGEATPSTATSVPANAGFGGFSGFETTKPLAFHLRMGYTVFVASGGGVFIIL